MALRSHSIFWSLSGLATLLALGGCLVSEEPVLNEKNGRAKPLRGGDYVMCPISDDADESDCEPLTVTRDKSGLYLFVEDVDEPTQVRFRKIARRAYAAQLMEDSGEYIYYYAKRKGDVLRLTMMLCEQLAPELRDRLIDSGDLSSEDDDFETCIVESVKGLLDAARAYHRGLITEGEEFTLEFTPVPTAANNG